MSGGRNASRDRELVRHSHSFASVPMWDSADPERAPPPLPLNPGIPGSPSLTTRPNTSAAIMNAAKALEDKARESMSASSYTTNPMPQRSPERSLIKGATHKRMQSLQTTTVRDLKSFLDGVRSPERSPERPPTATRSGTPPREFGRELFPQDLSPSRTPTPATRDAFKDPPYVLKDTSALRPSSRPLQKAILGENTPPSATMLALQNMTVPRELLDPPLSNISNSSSRAPAGASAAAPPPPAFDAISNQLLSITNIVSNLQKDMTQLSRRSKDNATDLVSLKEATSARDEDIRKSLKELVVTMHHAPQVAPPDFSRSAGSSVGMKDPHMTPTKQFTMPRMTSPGSFLFEDRIGSPNPNLTLEGAASVAMLEKIIREMVTKDGQERLIANLQTLVDKATGETAKKVTELVEFVKQGSQSRANAPPGSASFEPSPGSGPLTRAGDSNSAFPLHKVADGAKPYTSPKAADFVGDEMLKYLRKIKDSVAEAGGVTMGMKAMVQDLRGEVLGMGRDLARKLEEVEQANHENRAIEPGHPNPEVALIVQEGLANIKQHMDQVMLAKRRNSISSTMTRNTVDNQEVYEVVKHALAERGLDEFSAQSALADKEAIVSAVREAYEAYQPNIKIEQIGLERDEVLQCLREGLQDYRGTGALSREEIERTIQDALQHVKLPPPINEAHEIRDEVLMAVRDCLEDFKPSMMPHQSLNDLSRQVILDAIREGLADREQSMPQQLELEPEVLFEAVRAGLESTRPHTERQEDEVLQHLHALVDDMHSEFKEYSSANGRDTEQVLDALKDGLDTLRSQIETYVDKAQDVTQKDEIVDNIRTELEKLRVDIQGYVSQEPREEQQSFGAMTDYLGSAFEDLNESLAKQILPILQDNTEIIDTLNAGFESMKSQVAIRDVDVDTNEEINEAMKQEFEQLKNDILGDTAHTKQDMIETLQAGFDRLHLKLGDGSVANTASEEVLLSLKEEFEHLRETLGSTLVRSGGAADKDDIIDAVRELIDGLRSELAILQQDSSKDNLASIQEDLEQLKSSLSTSLVRAEGSSDKEEILEALRSAFEDIKANSQSGSINEELLEAFHGELEQLRQSNGLTRQHARADTEEMLDAVRLGLDDLRSHLEKKIDKPEGQMFATNEILDALNDGLEGLHTDVMKTVDKPVDMTVSYEILDTLKDGISSLREEIASLKGPKAESPLERSAPTGNEVVLAEDPDSLTSREIVNDSIVSDSIVSDSIVSDSIISDSLRRNDLEKMEVMLAQLYDKVESMDANIHSPPSAPEESTQAPASVVADDLVGIEGMLKDLQATLLQLQAREPVAAKIEGMATKEDTDAIEVLLDNVKAKIEELNLPDTATMVTKENLEEVELVVRTTSETIEALSQRIAEEGATKEDITVIQVIVDDIKLALDEMKTNKTEDEDAMEKVTKTDIDDLAALVCDIKAKVDEIKLPDGDNLPSKADMEELTALILDFRESHDKLQTTYEADIFKTATCFDERKQEAEGIADSITEVKVALDEVKEEIMTSLTDGGGFGSLKESFKSLEDTIGVNFCITADVKDLMETVSREFGRAHDSIGELLNGQEEKSVITLAKQDESKEAIITGLFEKIDDRFDVLMTKYDDAQLLADEQTKVMKEKSEEQEKILETTKVMADELKLTIDTLGASIAGMGERYDESSQKWSADSAHVSEKIDEAIAKLEEQKQEEKMEHSHTRDEVANMERNLNGLQDNITEYHPKFMVTLREIQALVKQHFDQSQKTQEAADEQVRVMNEEARARAEDISSQFAKLPALLPALLPPPPPAIEAAEKYDDGQVQEKLDKLIGHATEAEKSAAQLERLDEIHKQVLATAAEVNEFVAKQTQLITDGNDSKEREAEEVGILLERRRTQKEQLEADIEELRAEKERAKEGEAEEVALLVERRRGQKEQLETDIEQLRAEKERVMQELREEKDKVMAELKEEKERTLLEVAEEKNSLLAIVASLQAERENLANQKVRLTGEVSSLHTALEIRREELHLMDAKADALERRILNGIMDHSRALMMAKGGTKGGPKSPSKLKKRTSVDTAKDESKPMAPPSTAANGLSLALKPRPAIRRNGPPPNPANRRILSLSQISGNTPTGAQAYVSAANTLSNSGNMKRSHSVKTNYMRKSSWNGRPTAAVTNKENEALSEVDETEGTLTPVMAAVDYSGAITDGDHGGDDDDDDAPHDNHSETGTERRHSLASGSYDGSYAEGETPDFDGRSSYGGSGSEYTYGSGSYMTGSDLDRRTSYGSTAARSTRFGEANSIAEGSEEGSSGQAQSGADDDEATETVSGVTASEVGEAVGQVGEDMKKALRVWAPASDSGLGTEIATARREGESDGDYFRRAAEDESTVG